MSAHNQELPTNTPTPASTARAPTDTTAVENSAAATQEQLRVGIADLDPTDPAQFKRFTRAAPATVTVRAGDKLRIAPVPQLFAALRNLLQPGALRVGSEGTRACKAEIPAWKKRA